jgi:hypothetical protein
MTFMKTLRTQWDRAAAVGALALAFIVLLVGFLGVSGTEFVAEQLPYVISGGLVGLTLVVISATLWISADLRDEWRKLDVLDARLEQALKTSVTAVPDVPEVSALAIPAIEATSLPREPAPRKPAPRKAARRAASVGSD